MSTARRAGHLARTPAHQSRSMLAQPLRNRCRACFYPCFPVRSLRDFPMNGRARIRRRVAWRCSKQPQPQPWASSPRRPRGAPAPLAGFQRSSLSERFHSSLWPLLRSPRRPIQGAAAPQLPKRCVRPRRSESPPAPQCFLRASFRRRAALLFRQRQTQGRPLQAKPPCD